MLPSIHFPLWMLAYGVFNPPYTPRPSTTTPFGRDWIFMLERVD